MKKVLLIFAIIFPMYAHAGIYTNSNFKPYIGIAGGINIADYTINTDLDDLYYSATINAGARIARNFGAELFFSHSSTNELEYIYDYTAQNHEIYYMAFGFDIFGYYGITHEIDFFTTFGVANYKIYNKCTYISPTNETEEKISDNNVSTRIGIGLMYAFPGDNVSATLRYNYTPIGNELMHNMSEFTFGVRYIF